MGVSSNLINGLNSVFTKAGKQIRIRYFNQTIGTGSVYDDDAVLTKSGNDLWTSGVVFPLSKSADGFLMEQGLIMPTDTKLFVNGSLSFTGSHLGVRIGLGSPISAEYTIISEGTQVYEAESIPIYKKVYLRLLPLGSLIGE